MVFLRVGMEDTVKIRCYQLEEGKFTQCVEDELHGKYANRVIPNQGLAILVRDFEKVGAPYIFPGQGHVHVKVKFGLIVFRPFVDEVMQATIRFSDKSGILCNSFPIFCFFKKKRTMYLNWVSSHSSDNWIL